MFKRSNVQMFKCSNVQMFKWQIVKKVKLLSERTFFSFGCHNFDKHDEVYLWWDFEEREDRLYEKVGMGWCTELLSEPTKPFYIPTLFQLKIFIQDFEEECFRIQVLSLQSIFMKYLEYQSGHKLHFGKQMWLFIQHTTYKWECLYNINSKELCELKWLHAPTYFMFGPKIGVIWV